LPQENNGKVTDDIALQQEWTGWMCEQGKTGGDAKLQVDDFVANERYDICIECFKKIAVFCETFLKLSFENTISTLMRYQHQL